MMASSASDTKMAASFKWLRHMNSSTVRRCETGTEISVLVLHMHAGHVNVAPPGIRKELQTRKQGRITSDTSP